VLSLSGKETLKLFLKRLKESKPLEVTCNSLKTNDKASQNDWLFLFGSIET
jgi:hypothetical protein